MIPAGILASGASIAAGGGSGALYTYDATTDTASGSSTTKPTVARNAAGFAVTSANVLVAFAANTLRRTAAGMHWEPAATNLLQSNGSLGTPWTKGSVTAGAEAGAEGSGTSAYMLTSTAGGHALYQDGIPLTAAQYTLSAFGKLGSWANPNFSVTDLNGGDLLSNVSYGSQVNSSAFKQFSATFTGVSTANARTLFFRDSGTSGLTTHLQYPQLELGTSASTPIVTPSGATATRPADVITFPVSGATKARITFEDATFQDLTGYSAASAISISGALSNSPRKRVTKLELFA